MGATKPKGLNKTAKIGYGHLYMICMTRGGFRGGGGGGAPGARPPKIGKNMIFLA